MARASTNRGPAKGDLIRTRDSQPFLVTHNLTFSCDSGGGGDPSRLPFLWECDITLQGYLRIALRGGSFFRFALRFEPFTLPNGTDS